MTMDSDNSAGLDDPHLINCLTDAVLFQDTGSGRLLAWNAQAGTLLGINADRALTEVDIADLIGGDPPFSKAELRARIDSTIRGKSQRFDWRIKTTKEIRECRVTLKATQVEDRRCIAAALRMEPMRPVNPGHGIDAEPSAVRADAQEIRELLQASLGSMAHGFIVFGSNGEVKIHNSKALQLLELSPSLLHVGANMRALAEFQLERGDFNEAEMLVGEQVRAYARGLIELSEMDIAGSHTRKTPGGRYLQINTSRMNSGNFVRTYSDVTEHILLSKQLDAMLADYGALRHRESAKAQTRLIAALSELALHRDDETGRHIDRTSLYVRALAESMAASGKCPEALDAQWIDRVVQAAPMHDLGKIGIPDHVLRKPGRHTAEEQAVMRTHALIGESVLITAAEGSGPEFTALLRTAARIAGGHHERWEGNGYPRGLAGAQIPLEARLMAVADMYDALTTARVYKPAWSHEKATAEILSLAGTAFDPQVVQAFAQESEAFRQIARRLADDTPQQPTRN